MKPELFIQQALLPALQLLPPAMNSSAARAMVVAACLQESKINFRRQVGGPARGYGQFELNGGVRGVLTHPVLRPYIRSVLSALDYDSIAVTLSAEDCYIAIEHNDILLAAFSRLLLYSLPDRLPVEFQYEAAWQQYYKAWRPGKPHRETWDVYYKQAWVLCR